VLELHPATFGLDAPFLDCSDVPLQAFQVLETPNPSPLPSEGAANSPVFGESGLEDPLQDDAHFLDHIQAVAPFQSDFPFGNQTPLETPLEYQTVEGLEEEYPTEPVNFWDEVGAPLEYVQAPLTDFPLDLLEGDLILDEVADPPFSFLEEYVSCQVLVCTLRVVIYKMFDRFKWRKSLS